jgi:hypothetical protein
MVAPLLNKSAQLAATRLGTAVGAAVAKAVAGPAGSAARTTLLPARRQAVAELAPRTSIPARVSQGLVAALAPRAALPGPLRKTGTEFIESAVTDVFAQTTGISAKTSPTLGGAVYEATKALVALTDARKAPPPKISPPTSALARLLDNSRPVPPLGLPSLSANSAKK